MKPSKEQIKAWVAELVKTHTGAHQDVWLPFFAELAYAAGRKAGMEEAAKECDKLCDRYGHFVAPMPREFGAADSCARAIRAAMEADK